MEQFDPLDEHDDDVALGGRVEALPDDLDEALQVEGVALAQGRVHLVLQQVVHALRPLLELQGPLLLIDHVEHVHEDILELLVVVKYGLLDDFDNVEEGVAGSLHHLGFLVFEALKHWVQELIEVLLGSFLIQCDSDHGQTV